MTLVICRNDGHEASVRAAFDITGEEALYVRPYAVLAGARFDKIVAFTPLSSTAEQRRFGEWIESIECRLAPGGKLLVL